MPALECAPLALAAVSVGQAVRLRCAPDAPASPAAAPPPPLQARAWVGAGACQRPCPGAAAAPPRPLHHTPRGAGGASLSAGAAEPSLPPPPPLEQPGGASRSSHSHRSRLRGGRALASELWRERGGGGPTPTGVVVSCLSSSEALRKRQPGSTPRDTPPERRPSCRRRGGACASGGMKQARAGGVALSCQEPDRARTSPAWRHARTHTRRAAGGNKGSGD